MQINKPKWDAWKMLPEAVRTGAVPFALAHGGLDMHQVMLHWRGLCMLLRFCSKCNLGRANLLLAQQVLVQCAEVR